MLRRGCGLDCKLTQAQFRLKTLADNNIKRAFMKILAQNYIKRTLFFTILQKTKYLAPRASHMPKVRSHVIRHNMLYGAYSALDTLFYWLYQRGGGKRDDVSHSQLPNSPAVLNSNACTLKSITVTLAVIRLSLTLVRSWSVLARHW